MNQRIKIVLKALMIAGCGLFLVALYWLIYVGLTLLLEELIAQGDPQVIRQDVLRNSSALVVGVMTIELMRTRLHDIIKAIIVLAGLTVFLMALVLHFYQIMGIAIVLTVIVCGIIILMIIKQRKPWFYYYAVVLAVIISYLYAWPR